MFWAWMLALIGHGEEYISREENRRDTFMDVGQKRMCGLIYLSFCQKKETFFKLMNLNESIYPIFRFSLAPVLVTQASDWLHSATPSFFFWPSKHIQSPSYHQLSAACCKPKVNLAHFCFFFWIINQRYTHSISCGPWLHFFHPLAFAAPTP